MGQNFAGVAALQMTMPKAGQQVTLRFAERLNPDETVYTTNLRSALGHRYRHVFWGMEQ